VNSANDEDRTRDHRPSLVRYVAGRWLQRQHAAVAQLNAFGRADLDGGADDGPDAHGVIVASSAKLVRRYIRTLQHVDTG
jgi:hypothetical protein